MKKNLIAALVCMTALVIGTLALADSTLTWTGPNANGTLVLNAGVATNCTFYGNGVGLTNLPVQAGYVTNATAVTTLTLQRATITDTNGTAFSVVTNATAATVITIQTK